MKVFCPLCNEINEVNRNELTHVCEHCHKSYSTTHAVDAMSKHYSLLLFNAKRHLYQTLNFKKAEELYLEAISFNETDLFAISGYIVATLYQNTFLDTHFKDIIPIIEKYEITLDKENSKTYISLISDILNQCDYYVNNARERVVKNNKFLNKEYFDTYFSSLEDIKNVLKYIEDSLILVDRNELEMKIKSDDKFMNSFNEYYEFIEKEKNKDYSYYLKEEDGYIEHIEHENVVYIDKKAKKNVFLAIGVSLTFLVLFIIFLILNFVYSNSIYLIISIISLVLGIASFFIIRYIFNKKIIENNEE